MRRKRIMIIGPTNCGKTTLAYALNECDGPIKKTQNIIYGKNTIDVPGSYIENVWMYKYLISAVQDASLVLVLVDQSSSDTVYSPGFARVFNQPVLGVITKTDVNPENEEFCMRQLMITGIDEPIFKICAKSGEGISALQEYLFQQINGNEGKT